MECLIAFGTGIVGKLAEYTVEPVIRQVGYVFRYSDNLRKLRNQVDDLGNAKLRVQHAVQTEKDKGKRIENDVQSWLTKVDEITEQSKNFLDDEHQAKIKCLHGFCPNLKNRHQLSRKSTKLAQEVADLFGKKDFSSFGYEVKPEEVFNQDNQAFASRISVVNDILDELRKSRINKIGVYGIGGVGKTTLVKEVYRQVTAEKLFDDVVIILDVNQNPSIERIQKEIAEKLGLDHRENETEAGRARHIADRIKGKKTLVILDDVWETIELEAVGLSGMTTLTILFTSRSGKVLSSYMCTQKEYRLEVLGEEESWSLFEKTAGDIVKDPTIRPEATKIMQKCGGLPLLVVTVARGLKNSSLPTWRDALRRMEKLDGQELTEKAYSAIEWSYSKLENEDLKSLFLLCASVLRSGNSVSILYLLKYSMGLGLIKNVDTMEEAGNALHSMLEKLQHSCLLQEGTDDNSRFRMHDLVKDVAKRVASRDHHILSCARGNEFKEWPNDEFCRKCTLISLRCNPPKFPEVLHCPELTMFHITRSTEDLSQEIPCRFFNETRKLRVLDLTSFCMPSLPSLEFLKDLRTLCLDHCIMRDISLIGQLQNLEILSFLKSKFEVLPKEIGQLTRLRLLNLTGCSQLIVISPNVLSSLNRLQHLKMGDSFNQWEAEGFINSKRSNANLEELRHLSQLTLLQIHIPDANTLPADLFSEKLERFQICIGSAWQWADVDENLNTLKLKLTTHNELDRGLKLLLKRTEDLYLDGAEGVNTSILYQLQTEDFQRLKHLHFQNNADFSYINNQKGNFPNLTWLAVSEINSSRCLLSSSIARSLANLKRLQISKCQIMEEIVSMDEENADNMFCQLQVLELKDLPNLTKFCSRCYTELPNPSFERLQSGNISSRMDMPVYNTTCEEAEDSNSKGDLEIVIQHFLFDNKVELPNLKELLIDGLPKLTSIWTNHFSPSSSNTLEKVEIVSCENLKSIFPATVARSLQQLKRLEVESCGVEEIISNTDGTQTAPVFDFPKLTFVNFKRLPQLRSFYPGLHTSNWPSLIILAVQDCDNVQIFKEGKHELNSLYTPNKQSLFSFEKDSFPNLEYLTFSRQSWDNPPLHSYTKLKGLIVYAHFNSSIDSLEKLLGVSSGEIHAVGSGTLPHLRELQLHGMRELMYLGEDSHRPVHFPNLEILILKECDSLKSLRSSAVSFKTLTTLQVSVCKGLKYLMTYSMAKSLTQLTKLEVEDCEEIIEIISSSEEHDSRNEIEFKGLTLLKLSILPRLRSFCSGTRIVKFPSMVSIIVTSCTQLETFIFDPKVKGGRIGKGIEDGDSKENYETEESNFLFDEKVEFPNLKSLSIKGAAKLTTVWHNQLTNVQIHGCENPTTNSRDVPHVHDASKSQMHLFHCQNLELVDVDSCPSLKSIFPVSMATNLQHLLILRVINCGVLEEIVANEERSQAFPTFVFPKVAFVIFGKLPQLRSFYPRNHVSNWPSLTTLQVFGCDKVDILAEEISSLDGNRESTKQSLFLVGKDSFPNLETLRIAEIGIWNGPLPVKLFSKLTLLDVAADFKSKSLVFLDKLLVDIEAGNTGSSSGSVGTGAHGQLTHLRELRLWGIDKLMHLGENNSQSVCPNFPNLEILMLKYCPNLRDLRSSTISFETLTTLEVSDCHGLKYLLTYSMAKSLTRLTKLQVESCSSLVEIVGSNEDDDDSADDDFTFRRLKYLKLSKLPRLQSFCSRNRAVKFPSLETLSISNRLKLKIFPPEEMLQATTEGEDTDVDMGA